LLSEKIHARIIANPGSKVIGIDTNGIGLDNLYTDLYTFML